MIYSELPERKKPLKQAVFVFDYFRVAQKIFTCFQKKNHSKTGKKAVRLPEKYFNSLQNKKNPENQGVIVFV